MTQGCRESDLPRARTSLKLPERSVGALFNRFYNVTVSAVKRRECSGSPSAGSFQCRLCVRRQRGQHTHPRRVAQAGLVVQFAAEAEVQHDELRARPDEEVAGVRVGMEHAVQEQLLAVGVGDQLRYGLEVYAGVLEGIDVGDLDPLQVLHDQHTAGGVLPVDPGHDDVRAGGEVGGDELRVVALVDEVQLLRHVPGNLLDDGPEVQVALQRRQDAQEESNAVQVRLNDVPYARILHLDRHRAAVFQHRPVDLGEGRRGLPVAQVEAPLANRDRLVAQVDAAGQHGDGEEPAYALSRVHRRFHYRRTRSRQSRGEAAGRVGRAEGERAGEFPRARAWGNSRIRGSRPPSPLRG